MLGLLPFFNDVPSLLVLSASLVALNIGVTEMASKFILVQLYLLISRFANPTAFSNLLRCSLLVCCISHPIMFKTTFSPTF